MAKLGQGMITDGHADPRSLRGVERRREMRAEDADEIKRIAEHLVAGLGREPVFAEIVAGELIGRTVVKIRRLAERGRDDIAERELLQRLMMTTPFGMVAAPPPVPPTVDIFARSPVAPRPQYRVAEKGDELIPDEATEQPG